MSVQLDDESLLRESVTRTSLARFSIHSLSTSGSMFVDNMMTMALSVGNCLLEDTRSANTGKLTRLMQRKPDSNAPATTVGDGEKVNSAGSNMMELSYRMLKNNVIGEHIIVFESCIDSFDATGSFHIKWIRVTYDLY